MEQSFWENKWARNEIGFHLPRPHPLLVRYWPTLSLSAESRVFVPLCGKALDLQYLLGKGHRLSAQNSLAKPSRHCLHNTT